MIQVIPKPITISRLV